MTEESPPEWTKGPVRRPVDMSETFNTEGGEYCRFLITDPRSDAYLKMYKDESSELATPQQEGGEEET